MTAVPLDPSLATLRACYGLLVPVPAGSPRTLRHFLLEVLGFAPAYAEERIQTILLDGLVVDGLDTRLYPGARLALSAAMPGVVGATLRKGGHYAPMRAGITLQEASPAAGAAAEDKGQGFWVELRCFNEIAREAGPALLRMGVALPDDGLTPELHTQTLPLPAHVPPLCTPGVRWLPAAKENTHA